MPTGTGRGGTTVATRSGRRTARCGYDAAARSSAAPACGRGTAGPGLHARTSSRSGSG